jgi:membrane-associated phospholipid phosphatase
MEKHGFEWIMTVENLAEFVAQHALLIFLAGMVVMLILVAALWQIIARYGDRLWRVFNTVAKFSLRVADAGLFRGRLRNWQIAESLALAVGIGFAAVLFILSIFFELTEALEIDAELGRFDHALARALRATTSDNTYQFFSIATHLADTLVLTLLCVVVAIGLLWRKHWLYVASWLIAIIGNALLTKALKALFQRLRPLHDHGFAVADGWSFPSGHASGVLVAYGMLAYLAIYHTERRWHLLIVSATIALILLVGNSRIFLQVHFFSDVLAGFCSGAAWLVICVIATEIAQRQRSVTRPN